MKLLALILSICCIPFLGFSQETHTVNLTHDGLEREYIIYVPANYTGDTPVPLLFNFHGYGSNATEQMFYGDFRSIADTEGFIIIHPQGEEDPNGTTHFNVGGFTAGSTIDDVGFTEAMIDAVTDDYNIDLTRVYSTGMSNGGFMSFLLACQLSDKIAAVASVTGSMTPETYNSCNPQHPMPVLQIHGDEDGTVPYNGAIWTRSINDVMDYWVDYNQCSASPTTTAIPNTNTDDGSTVERFVYENGDNGVSTEHFKITGGGHTWPDAFINIGSTNKDINASAEVWRFFSQYDINGLLETTSIESSDKPDLKIQIYPNPTTHHIQIATTAKQVLEYQLSTLTGQTVLTGLTSSNQHEIDLSNLSEGVYILNIANRNYKIFRMK